MEAGREFQFLEVIGTNVLAKEVVRHLYNLTAKECWESAKRVLRAKHALGGIIDFNFYYRFEIFNLPKALFQGREEYYRLFLDY